MDGLIGKSLGKYQIVEQLGEGGMATVYKAYDQSLERYVAIKVIRATSVNDPLFLGRFQREAKALAKLDHPYILKVLDYGESEGVPYLVMPFVGHGTLKQFTSEQIPYERAFAIIIPIAEALSYAHKRNIIHRDVKPANILFGESGEPILSDFGIAKMLDVGEQTQLTGTGLGIGTPAYMAPEQWTGAVDERTDIYALGIVLYELLTSRCPFQAETPAAILLKQVQDPLPRPKTFAPNLPENVEAVVFKALAKDPAYRFQNMQEFIHAMKDVLQGKHPIAISPPTMVVDQNATVVAQRPPIIAPTPMVVPSPVQTKKKNPLPIIIGGAAGVVLVLVLLFTVVIPKINSIAQQKVSDALQNAINGQTTSATQAITPANPLGGLFSNPTEASSTKKTQGSTTVIEKLPPDVPVFVPNNGDVITSQSDTSTMFYYSTASSQKEVMDFYLTKMNENGWKLENTTDMGSQGMVMYAFTKDTRTAVINVILSDATQTYIQIVIDTSG